MNRRRTLGLAPMVVAAAALLAAACSESTSGDAGSTQPGSPPPGAIRSLQPQPPSAQVARPTTTGEVKLLSPVNGAVINSSDVKILIQLTGAEIVPITTIDIVPDEGHIHVYLDNQLVSMNFARTGRIRNLRPGLHVLRVEFVASDHLPFEPREFTAVTFDVQY